MPMLDTSLFASPQPYSLGVGFHNLGRDGLLRASNVTWVEKIVSHYGERCGHIPFDAETIRIVVPVLTPSIQSHMEYLSTVFGRDLKAATPSELRHEQQGMMTPRTLVTPYINVPDTTPVIRETLQADAWGLPVEMASLLKNKADLYQFLSAHPLSELQVPDYRIVPIAEVAQAGMDFLRAIEDLVTQAGLPQYPLGIMLRAAESDGNYGCCQISEAVGKIVLLPNGDSEQIQFHDTWQEALLHAQQILVGTMDIARETRVVMSRFLELVDSPGMSVVIMDGHIVPLRWNSQLQKGGSKACVGTSSYRGEIALQQLHEESTIRDFEILLKQAAKHFRIDFSSIRGIANIDLMIPGPLEMRLQQQRGQKTCCYVAECNPRWTNYTDAIMTTIGANRLVPTINNMLKTIKEGIATFDKYDIPHHADPLKIRERIMQADRQLQPDGTRIICRMARNPLGVIFVGDLQRAQRTLDEIHQEFAA